jgi:hypothetical protein
MPASVKRLALRNNLMEVPLATSSSKSKRVSIDSPFERVPMRERIDDALACIATLAGSSLDDVFEEAISAGLPRHGPYWVDGPMIKHLLDRFGYFSIPYKAVSSLQDLPDLAILLADFDARTEIGRHVIWCRRGSEASGRLGIVIDPATWIRPEQQVTSELTHLNLTPPIYYIEVHGSAVTREKCRALGPHSPGS